MNPDYVINRTSAFTLGLIKNCKNIHKICSTEDNLQYEFFLEDDFSICKNLPRLYYGTFNEKIVGFLSVFVIDDSHCEICMFVMPKYRGGHLGRNLFMEFQEDYINFYVETSIHPNNIFGKNYINTLDFQYNNSNVLMELDLIFLLEAVLLLQFFLIVPAYRKLPLMTIFKTKAMATSFSHLFSGKFQKTITL